MSDKKNEDLAEKILVLKDLIAYQDGSVVSRMIVYKKSGTITLFAFDTGEGLSIGGTGITVDWLQMIIMPAGKPHALHAKTRFKMMLSMIHE